MSYCLTLLECGSVQKYIFASNRLTEIIGGSYLVKQATEDVLYSTLQRLGKVDYAGWQEQGPLRIFEDTSLKAEVLYSGGGNAAIVFDSDKTAELALQDLSSRLLTLAPGLILLAASTVLKEDTVGVPANSALKDAILAAFKDLDKLKYEGRVGLRREGLAITHSCVTTGLAASIVYEYGNQENTDEIDYISAGAAARREAERKTRKKNISNSLEQDFRKHLTPPESERGYDFPYDLDNIGGREGEDHIAVVHIDGNRIGQRLRKIIKDAVNNQTLAQDIRRFSSCVRAAGTRALGRCMDDLYRSIEELEDRIKVKSREGINFFPLRPLIYGGDDLTFVCEGRLGLALAARYLEYFAVEKDSKEEFLSACAGVAIARSHFPLARVYGLAEELCANAKRKTREPDEGDSSWLDFHIIFSGLTGRLEQIRPFNREIPTGHPQALYWRPWRIAASGTTSKNDRYSWEEGFCKLQGNFANAWPRSQVKSLGDALVAGSGASNEFMAQARLRGRELLDLPGLKLGENGWDGERTPLYDPIEALDFFLEVKK